MADLLARGRASFAVERIPNVRTHERALRPSSASSEAPSHASDPLRLGHRIYVGRRGVPANTGGRSVRRFAGTRRFPLDQRSAASRPDRCVADSRRCVDGDQLGLSGEGESLVARDLRCVSQRGGAPLRVVAERESAGIRSVRASEVRVAAICSVRHGAHVTRARRSARGGCGPIRVCAGMST